MTGLPAFRNPSTSLPITSTGGLTSKRLRNFAISLANLWKYPSSWQKSFCISTIIKAIFPLFISLTIVFIKPIHLPDNLYCPWRRMLSAPLKSYPEFFRFRRLLRIAINECLYVMGVVFVVPGRQLPHHQIQLLALIQVFETVNKNLVCHFPLLFVFLRLLTGALWRYLPPKSLSQLSRTLFCTSSGYIFSKDTFAGISTSSDHSEGQVQSKMTLAPLLRNLSS